MPTITPFLWFDGHAEEAMQLYTGIFKDAKVLSVTRAQGQVMAVRFSLLGQEFMGLNGGPHFTFNEAVSFFVGCDTQAEIDGFWSQLVADGGAPGRCGWLKDKFGLSWQIVPKVLTQLLGDPDRARSSRAMAAMLQMEKLDIAALQAAFDGAV